MTFSNISSISVTKGIDIFIKAIALVENKQLQFDIVGQASDVEKNFEIEMKRYVKENNLSNINFTGFISDMSHYLDSIDVVVLTSVVEEAFGLVLAEGGAKGKILIATDVGGVREVVDDSYGNIIVPPNNSTLLKEAICTVAKYDKNTINKIKEKNMQYVREKFTLKKQIDTMTEIYKELLI